jgi:hypothetical protein
MNPEIFFLLVENWRQRRQRQIRQKNLALLQLVRPLPPTTKPTEIPATLQQLQERPFLEEIELDESSSVMSSPRPEPLVFLMMRRHQPTEESELGQGETETEEALYEQAREQMQDEHANSDDPFAPTPGCQCPYCRPKREALRNQQAAALGQIPKEGYVLGHKDFYFLYALVQGDDHEEVVPLFESRTEAETFAENHNLGATWGPVQIETENVGKLVQPMEGSTIVKSAIRREL